MGCGSSTPETLVPSDATPKEERSIHLVSEKERTLPQGNDRTDENKHASPAHCQVDEDTDEEILEQSISSSDQPAPRSPGNTDHEPMNRMNVSQGCLLSRGDSFMNEPDFFDESETEDSQRGPISANTSGTTRVSGPAEQSRRFGTGSDFSSNSISSNRSTEEEQEEEPSSISSSDDSESISSSSTEEIIILEVGGDENPRTETCHDQPHSIEITSEKPKTIKKDKKKDKKSKKKKKRKKERDGKAKSISKTPEQKVLKRMGKELTRQKKSSQIKKSKKKDKSPSRCYEGAKLKGSDAANAEELFALLNINPLEKSYDLQAQAIADLIDATPSLCSLRYFFDTFQAPAFPLSMLCALGASVQLTSQCHAAHPGALDRPDGWLGTALHYACAYKAKLDVVEFLLREDPDAAVECNFFQSTALHLACAFQASTEITMLLLQSHLPAAQIADKDGCLPLHLACSGCSGDKICSLEVMQALMSAFPLACVARSADTGSTPLHLALGNSDVPLPAIKALVKGHSAALQVVDDKGRLPLHIAVSAGDAKIVKFLLKSFPEGRNHRQEHKNKTPLELATGSSMKKVFNSVAK